MVRSREVDGRRKKGMNLRLKEDKIRRDLRGE